MDTHMSGENEIDRWYLCKQTFSPKNHIKRVRKTLTLSSERASSCLLWGWRKANPITALTKGTSFSSIPSRRSTLHGSLLVVSRGLLWQRHRLCSRPPPSLKVLEERGARLISRPNLADISNIGLSWPAISPHFTAYPNLLFILHKIFKKNK